MGSKSTEIEVFFFGNNFGVGKLMQYHVCYLTISTITSSTKQMLLFCLRYKNFVYFLFEAGNTCFLLIPVKFAAILRKLKFLKNPRGRPKWRTCCEMTAAIATVLN